MSNDGYPITRNPFHQSPLFWGCVSTVIAIVIAVVVAMSTDVRWLLIFAWPFAAISAWEFARACGPPRRIKWIAGSGALASAIALMALYFWLAPPVPRVPTPKRPQQVMAPTAQLPPEVVTAIPVLHRHYAGGDRDRLSAVLYDLHMLLNETVMPAQLKVHQELSELPALVHPQGTQTTKARLSALRTVFADARDDYIHRFKSGSHYYADEIEDITSNKDELNAEIAALDQYIAALSALPYNAPQNLIELMKPYELSLRDANVGVGNWVVRCNERIKAKRDALQ